MYAYILLIFVVIFYSGNILTGRAINELPPITIAFFRLLVAFIALLPLGARKAWKTRQLFFTYKKPFLLMTLTGITLFNTCIYGALQFSTATRVSVLEAVIPVATALLSVWVLKERLIGIQWVGVLLSFTGAVWVITEGDIFTLIQSWNTGDILMIGAILLWAVYSVNVKNYMHLFPSYAAVLVMTGISVIALLPILLVEWALVGVPYITTPGNMAGLLYLGIFPSFIALILYNRAIDLLSASKASVFLSFLPVVTMIGAALWLGEKINSVQIIGALIVIGGVFLTNRPKKTKRSYS
ncbi:DMT family transporter [Virgibacillus kekensis]|uniref:DMT family transporter n=1 Tax=Virgibacillus kekensis TaxID=202261 RepID=A0ABV9DMF3_9BACI